MGDIADGQGPTADNDKITEIDGSGSADGVLSGATRPCVAVYFGVVLHTYFLRLITFVLRTSDPPGQGIAESTGGCGTRTPEIPGISQ
jgi:hypothetical protein